MAYITKEYLENNIKTYDQYRKLDKEGQANGLATLDANGKLPASQSTQSDWNQSNSSAIDYIKNKPTIPSGVTFGGNSVTSIVQGTNTTMSLSSGALTISASGGGGGGGDSPWWDNTGANEITINFNQSLLGHFCASATINLPSSIVFAELTYYPMNTAGTAYEGTPVINPAIKSSSNISFSITGSMKAISDSTPSFVSLRFATSSHTYHATIRFTYDEDFEIFSYKRIF